MKHMVPVIAMIALPLVVPAHAGAARVNAKQLRISLSFVEGERSRDSNSQSYSVQLVGDKVTYSGPRPPCERGRCAHGKVTFALDHKTYEAALRAIERGKLTTRFKEKKGTRDPGRYVKLSLTVTLGGKTARTTIVGMRSSRGGSKDLLGADAKNRVSRVNSLLWAFRTEAQQRLPSK